jgi:threonine dehydrogenase-like Zn-dependent dehydrogenase
VNELVEDIKASFVVAPRKTETRVLKMPQTPRNAILTKIEITGVCGTDVHIWKNPPPNAKFPLPIGHEWISVIEEIGEEAEPYDVWGHRLQVGDRIAYRRPWHCGDCLYCSFLKVPWLCARSRPSRKETAAKPMSLPRIGAYANYSYVLPGDLIFKVPESLPSEIAVLADPLGTALYTRECMDRAGLVVAIQGSGPIGLLSLFCAKLGGAWKTIVIGGPESRLKLCEEFGADHTINIFEVADPQERIEIVKSLTPENQGPDVVVEAAGVPIAFYEGLEMIRKAGVYVEVGHFTPRGKIEIDPRTILRKNITIRGFTAYPWQNFVYSLRILDRYQRQYPLDKMVSHRFSLDDVQKALEAAEQGIAMKAAMVP